MNIDPLANGATPTGLPFAFGNPAAPGFAAALQGALGSTTIKPGQPATSGFTLPTQSGLLANINVATGLAAPLVPGASSAIGVPTTFVAAGATAEAANVAMPGMSVAGTVPTAQGPAAAPLLAAPEVSTNMAPAASMVPMTNLDTAAPPTIANAAAPTPAQPIQATAARPLVATKPAAAGIFAQPVSLAAMVAALSAPAKPVTAAAAPADPTTLQPVAAQPARAAAPLTQSAAAAPMLEPTVGAALPASGEPPKAVQQPQQPAIAEAPELQPTAPDLAQPVRHAAAAPELAAAEPTSGPTPPSNSATAEPAELPQMPTAAVQPQADPAAPSDAVPVQTAPPAESRSPRPAAEPSQPRFAEQTPDRALSQPVEQPNQAVAQNAQAATPNATRPATTTPSAAAVLPAATTSASATRVPVGDAATVAPTLAAEADPTAKPLPGKLAAVERPARKTVHAAAEPAASSSAAPEGIAPANPQFADQPVAHAQPARGHATGPQPAAQPEAAPAAPPPVAARTTTAGHTAATEQPAALATATPDAAAAQPADQPRTGDFAQRVELAATPAAHALPGAAPHGAFTVPASTATPAATPAPVVSARHGEIGQQMGVEIARRVTDGGSELRVRMSPEHLGHVEVSLRFDDNGSLRATVRAENPAALELLRGDAADLRGALDQAGVRSDAQSFRFESRTGDGGGQDGRQQQQARQQQNAEQSSRSDGFTASAEPDDLPYTRLGTPGRVDLIA